MSLPVFGWTAPVLLDNFNEGKTENNLGGATGAWYDPEDKSIYCTITYDDKVYMGLQGKSMRLDYDIESGRENVHVPTNFSVSAPATVGNAAFNGYYSLFPPQDLTGYTYLIFWAKGDQEKGFTRSFKVEIKDGQAGYTKGYKVTGLTAEWKRFEVPLRDFVEIQSWSTIKEFVVIFSEDSVTRKYGTIYIDDIYFAENPEQNFSLPEGNYAAGRGKKPHEVDGRLKEWPRKAWRDISRAAHVEKGARNNTKDASARWAAAWDDRWLYLAVAFKDNERVNDEIGDMLWKGDCVEVFIAPESREFAWGDAKAFQLGFAPTSSAGNPARWAWFQRRAPTDEETKVAWNKSLNVVEVAVAWSFLGVTPTAGRDMGFSVSFHDRDLNDGTPQAKLTWSFGGLGANRVKVGRLVLE